MKYIPRVLEPLLQNYLKKERPPFHTLLLGGARQVGKSTLLKHLFPPSQHMHINLVEEAAFCEAIDATANFDDFTFLLQSRFDLKIGGSRALILDEAQVSKKLGNYVRFMKEKWMNQRVIITGSTLSNLFTHTEKPTGRIVEFTLRPFNFIEFLMALGKQTMVEKLKTWNPEAPFSPTVHDEMIRFLQTYLRVGGLPSVIEAYQQKSDYLRILANLFSFYKRDFESKLSTENLTSIFNQVFLRIAASTGSPIKLSSIVKSSSPGYKKLRDVLSILEQWHLVIRVDCETSKLSKVGTVTPKRYIFDHGIRYLQNPARFAQADLTDSQSSLHEDIGGLLENFILTELLSLNGPIALRSWEKTHQSGLVDFILTHGEQAYAIEVKSANRFNQKHLSSLLAYAEDFPKSHLILANLAPGLRFKTKSEILNIPLYALYVYLSKT